MDEMVASPGNSKKWIWITVIAVLVLAVILFFVFSKGSSKAEEVNAQTGTVETQLTQEENTIFEEDIIPEDEEIDLGELIE